MGSTNINWTARRRVVPGEGPCSHGATGAERCLDTTCERCWEQGHTVNPWHGCVEKTEACKNCYAKVTAENRMGLDVWGKNKPRNVRVDDALDELARIYRRSSKQQQPVGVFTGSMCDIFEDRDDLSAPRERYLLHANALLGRVHVLDLMLLTKRPENIERMIPFRLDRWPRSIWVGATIASPGEESFAEHLGAMKAKGAITFASVEPMLETGPRPGSWLRALDLVIIGGESGGGARPFDVDAAHRLVDACDAHGVKVWFKQMGSRWASKTGRGLLRKGASHGQDPYRWAEWARRRELPVVGGA